MTTYFRLLRYLKPHVGIFGLAVGSMLVLSLFGGVQLSAIFPLADRIITDKTIPAPEWLPTWLQGLVVWFNAIPPLTILGLAAVMIPFYIAFRGLFEFWQTFLMTDVAQRVIRDLREALFGHFTTLSLDYHKQNPTGMTMSRIMYDTSVVQNSITEGLTDLVLQSSTVMVCMVIALVIDWKLTLVVLITLPPMALFIGRLGGLLKKYSRNSQVAMGELNSTILESIDGIQVIQAFQSEAAAREKFARVNERSYRLLRKIQKRMNLLSPVTELIGAIGVAIVLWFGMRPVLVGDVSLGTFGVFLGAIGSVIHPFKRLARLHGINQQALASGERIFQILDTPAGVLEHRKARVLPAFHRELVYEHVSFNYGSQPALRGVSLTIPKGETLALVGPSGGGKTTLANLLLRFYDPSAGRVKIDGLDLRHVTLASLRGQIGLVTQETALFNDTVRANIALGRPSADLSEIVNAAKQASAHRFISKLPKGYDTIIGEDGDQLSGGERQRLAIARALLKNPPILILDEATSQLDAESEHLITGAIEQLMRGRTVLLIAHRLSSVRLAHRILLLQEGCIVEQGSHDELVHKSTLYRRFCELQLMHTGPVTPGRSSGGGT